MKLFFALVIPIYLFSLPLENSKGPLNGQLENGMTYYIHKNGYPKDTCNIRLVVKAGSLNEKEDEQGLAHFVEHMVFRGTNNYKDYEIKDFVDSLGGKFGHHTNAFTSFDTTEYFLTLPRTNDETLNKGLSLLNEMMFEARFDPALLEKERGIVLSEMGQMDSKMMSFYHKLYNFYDLGYLEKRFPIGKESLVKEVTADRMRAFYQRQYRPNKMALIIVGNIEPSEVLKKVQMIFTKKIPALMDAKQDRKIEPLKEPKILFHQDEKLGYNEICFAKLFKSKKKNAYSHEQIKEDCLKEFCLEYLNKQMAEKAKKSTSYFTPRVAEGPIFSDVLIQSLGFRFQEGQELEGCKKFIQDLDQLLVSPVDEPSLQSYIQLKINNCQKELINHHLIQHISWINMFRSDFLTRSGFVSFIDQNKLFIQQVNKITLEDVGQYLKKLKSIFLDCKYIIVNSTRQAAFCETELLNTISQTLGQKSELLDEHRQENDLVVFPSEPKEEKLVWSKSDIGYFESTLSNGLKIVVHPNSEKKETVFFKLLADGGVNQVDDKDLGSVNFSLSVGGDSGFANLDNIALSQYLQKHGIELGQPCGGCCAAARPSYFQMSMEARAIQGSFKMQSHDAFFRALFALFEAKRFSKQSYDYALKNAIQAEKSMAENDQVRFSRWMIESIYNNHPRAYLYKACDSDFSTAKRLFEQAFLNPRDFTLIISGEIDLQEIESSLLKYISPIENKCESRSKEHNVDIKTNPGSHIFYHNHNQGSSGMLLASLEKKEYNYQRVVCSDLLSKIISERLFSALRMQEAKSYGQFALITPSPNGSKSLQLFIHFVANDDQVPLMHQRVDDLLNDLIKKGVSNKELMDAKVKLIEEKKLAEQNPSRFIIFHQNRLFNKFSEKDLVNWKSIIESECNIDMLNAMVDEIKASEKTIISKRLK